MPRRHFVSTHARDPLHDPTIEAPPSEPPTVLVFSSSAPSLGRVSHLTHDDRGRIEQAAFVLGAADVDEGSSDVGSAMTSFRTWTPHHGSTHDLFAAVVLTLVVVDGVRCVVATWCWPDSRCQWVAFIDDEAKRATIVVDAAIVKANVRWLSQ